MQTLTQWITLI